MFAAGQRYSPLVHSSEHGPRPSRFRVAVYDYLMPLCAVFVLVLASFEIPASVRAARGEGQAGTFTAEHQVCGKGKYGGCSWYGTFVSADGSVRVEHAHLNLDVAHVGDTVPVLYEDDHTAKVYLAGSADLRWDALFLLGSAGYLTWWGWRLVRRARRQRRTLGVVT